MFLSGRHPVILRFEISLWTIHLNGKTKHKNFNRAEDDHLCNVKVS
jgi:hypothetical protein